MTAAPPWTAPPNAGSGGPPAAPQLPTPPRQRGARQLIPWSVLPLAVIATGLANGLWLRVFPASVIAGPLVGACVISVLLPVAVAGLFSTRLWLTALLDLAALVLFLLLVVLRDPADFSGLWSGLVHGPSELLSFALPLVGPRTLLVAPVVLCWAVGAVAGECIGREWDSLLPYTAWLAAFALSYAGTARGISSASSGRRQDTLVGAGLLLILLLIRAAQAWLAQDRSAEDAEATNTLPLRSMVIGAGLAAVLALGAAAAVQSRTLSGPPVAPQRTPAIRGGEPLTPLALVAELRSEAAAQGRKPAPVFDVVVHGKSPGYFPIATVDNYDGDAWSFQRTFRPSGGVIPAETDPAMRAGTSVAADFHVSRQLPPGTPWMPYLTRPRRLSGVSVDVDPDSGMIVPAQRLSMGDRYTVVATVPRRTFTQLTAALLPSSSAPPAERAVPDGLRVELDTIIASLAQETGVPSTPALPFLQAVVRDFRANYAVSTDKAATVAATPSQPGSGATSSSKPPRSSTPAGSSSVSATPGARTGSTSFRDVLESILGTSRAGTPEQYATLLALMARQLGVPARVATGFRVQSGGPDGLVSGNLTLTAADAASWVEVAVQNAGWVVLDGTPTRRSGPPQNSSVGAAPSHSPSSVSAPNGVITTATNSGNAVAPASHLPNPGGVTATDLLTLILLVVVLLAVVITVVLLARKRWRARRRRHVAEPRRRLIGAWHETLDLLAEAGLADLDALTSREVADLAAATFGARAGQHARSLGDTANAAIFNPARAVTAADADAAWSAFSLLRNEVRRVLGLRDRMAAATRYHRLTELPQLSAPESWADVVRPARRRRGRWRRGQAIGTRRH